MALVSLLLASVAAKIIKFDILESLKVIISANCLWCGLLALLSFSILCNLFDISSQKRWDSPMSI